MSYDDDDDDDDDDNNDDGGGGGGGGGGGVDDHDNGDGAMTGRKNKFGCKRHISIVGKSGYE